MNSYDKPLPNPNTISRPFWEAAKRHELVLQRCKDCGDYIFYPREVCSHCLSSNLEWTKACGKGKVNSYTVVRTAAHPGFKDDVPYVLAIIELAEGPRLTSNVIGCNVEDVKIDMPVSAVFDDVSPDVSLVKFKPD